MVTLAACGGAGTYNDAAGRAAPPGTELAAIVPSSPPATGQAGGFCEDIRQLQALFPALLAGPGAAPAAMNRALAVLNRMPADAPAEARPAARALRGAVGRIVADISSNPPNARDLGPASVRLQQALSEIIQYTAAHC